MDEHELSTLFVTCELRASQPIDILPTVNCLPFVEFSSEQLKSLSSIVGIVSKETGAASMGN